MKTILFLIFVVVALVYIGALFVMDRTHSLELARLEYEKKLLEIENVVFVDFHAAGYEPFICEDKRCWIKKEL